MSLGLWAAIRASVASQGLSAAFGGLWTAQGGLVSASLEHIIKDLPDLFVFISSFCLLHLSLLCSVPPFHCLSAFLSSSPSPVHVAVDLPLPGWGIQRLRVPRDHLGLKLEYPLILLVGVNLGRAQPWCPLRAVSPRAMSSVTSSDAETRAAAGRLQHLLEAAANSTFLCCPVRVVCQWWPDPSARAVSLSLSLSPVSFLPCFSIARSRAAALTPLCSVPH